MIQTLGIPVLNRGDLLLRCIESIDHPVDELFIVNNGQDESVRVTLEKIASGKITNKSTFNKVRVEQHRNLGCGPSWNYICRKSIGPWLFTGSDVKFLPESLGKAVSTLDNNKDASIICADGYSVFILTPLGISKVGQFDENFYPAYFEDVDHFRRVVLSGAKAVGVAGFSFVHGEAPHWGSSTVNSDPSLARKNGVTFSNNQEYYIRKWGGPPAKESFRSPFNRNVPMSWWSLDEGLRKRNNIW